MVEVAQLLSDGFSLHKEQPEGEEPNLGAGPEAADGRDTSLKDGAPEQKN